VIYLVRYLLAALYTVFWGGVACLAAPFDRDGRTVVWVGRHWVRWILRSCGVEVAVDGIEHVPRDRGCVVMSNHQSVFDTAALIATLPVHWSFVAKRELTWIPFFGWALRLGHQIIVDRSNREASVRSLARAAERVRAGTSVIIFPEGTRSSDATLREFKSGGFHLAIQAGAPIVPVAVSGSWRITPKRSLRIESGRVLVRYAAPIPTQGLRTDDRGELKLRVREAMLKAFDPQLQQGAEGAAQRGEAERSVGPR
jgi:1-acyl-sn-glycerol-3-phosphate acyltransferase